MQYLCICALKFNLQQDCLKCRAEQWRPYLPVQFSAEEHLKQFSAAEEHLKSSAPSAGATMPRQPV